MITFEKIRFKNFKSFGNNWNEIDFRRSQLTGVGGSNGAGKTASLLDSLCFVLYGKTFSGIPKGKLVNSINNKNCVVEVQFETNGNHYKVVRGLKPSIFQIYKNDHLLTEESNTRDYQSVLENQILKIQLKNFMQTIVVGTASYIPFMELNANDRRQVVENILGVSILTSMNNAVKEDVNVNKNKLYDLQYQIQNLKITIDSEQAIVETLKQSEQKNQQTIEQQISQLQSQIQDHIQQVKQLQADGEKLQQVVDKYDQFINIVAKISINLAKIGSEIDRIDSQIKFFTNNESCPICHQSLDQHYKQKVNEQLQASRQLLDEKKEAEIAKQNAFNEQQRRFDKFVEDYRSIINQINHHNATIQLLTNQIHNLQATHIDNSSAVEIVEKERSILENTIKYKDLVIDQQHLEVEKNTLEQAQVVLKDSGIKTAVVNLYLPIINQMINKYLSDMDFYISFELDNQFNETIKARHRDDFAYQNLSQGERRRLDLAILFTWRYIAELKNSCSTNLLIIDEILDSSLDAEGINIAMNMFRKLGNDVNLFVISHRENIVDFQFDRVIKISKNGQFSEVES